MRYRPSLRSIWTLIILGAVCYSLYLWAENSRVDYKMPYYDQKMQAADLMETALQTLVDYRGEDGQSDSFGDPRLDMLIGQQFSTITTNIGTFEDKIAGANPNFAALLVDLMTKAGVKEGDLVAVGFTGSHPGVNIAVLCACRALGVKPVTITAVGASWWGANDPDFTWLDMERILNTKGIIQSVPIAASLGGGLDEAAGLSAVGRNLLKAAIARNELSLISSSSVTESSAKRFELFMKYAAVRPFKAYINVGEGVSSLGHEENGRLIRDGLVRRLPVRNYPARGLVHLLNAQKIPIINLYDILAISRSYDLGGAQIPLQPVGEGEVFISVRYNIVIAAIAVGIALVIILLILRLDYKLFRLKDSGVDPETLM
ncbi:poly-gamma-glutamate system protein [bacterium]|nr:poly-gamma-glutamate system protein [bacterium]MBU1636330.1 poly-gamma-glutamate system protein [bacterium]RQV98281.1 MAG: poly-gamma-glutamate system protein [bacterium]